MNPFSNELEDTRVLFTKAYPPGIKVVDFLCFGLRYEPDFFNKSTSLEQRLQFSKQWEEHGSRLRDFFSAHPQSYVPGGTYDALARSTKRIKDFIEVFSGAPRMKHESSGKEFHAQGYYKNGALSSLVNSARFTHRPWEDLRKVARRRSISTGESNEVEPAFTSEEQSHYRLRCEQLGTYFSDCLHTHGVSDKNIRHRLRDVVIGSIALADAHPQEPSPVTVLNRTFLTIALVNDLYAHPVMGPTLPSLKVITSAGKYITSHSYGPSVSPVPPSHKPAVSPRFLAYGVALEK